MRQFCTYILAASSCPSQHPLPVGLGVTPGGLSEKADRASWTAGHGCITLQLSHSQASTAVALLVLELPPLAAYLPSVSVMSLGEAVLRHFKCSSLGVAQLAAEVFITTSFCGTSLYIFAHAFGQFLGYWTLF